MSSFDGKIFIKNLWEYNRFSHRETNWQRRTILYMQSNYYMSVFSICEQLTRRSVGCEPTGDISVCGPRSNPLKLLLFFSLSKIFYPLKIKCNVFSFVEVNFSTYVFNINKSISVLRKITKITTSLKKRFKVRHRRSVYIWQVMTSYRENNNDDDQL